MKIVTVLIAGAAILIILKTIRVLLNKAGQKYSYWKKFIRTFPLVEILSWTIYLFWGASTLLKDKNYYPYIVIILVLVLTGLTGWYIFRDVFAGLLFRMENDLKKGDFLKIGNVSGQIRSANLTNVKIVSDNGQIISIPNSKLRMESVSGMTARGGTEEFKIQLSFEKKFKKPEIEKKINSVVANTPWCNYKNPPVIKFQSENEDSYIYDLLVYTLNPQHHKIAEKLLNERLNSNHLQLHE